MGIIGFCLGELILDDTVDVTIFDSNYAFLIGLGPNDNFSLKTFDLDDLTSLSLTTILMAVYVRHTLSFIFS